MKLPDKAIDIIDEAGASIKINEKEKIKMLVSKIFKQRYQKLLIFQKVQLIQMKRLN